MPYNGNGIFEPLEVLVPGELADANEQNDIFGDFAGGLSNVLTRDGQAPMTAPLEVTDGTEALPGLAFANEPSTGLRRPGAGRVIIVLSGNDGPEFTTTGILVGGFGQTMVGEGKIWFGSTAPAGWLFAAGQVLAQASYTALFAIVGTAYNTGGEGAGNFRMPDLRGRVPFGRADMGGTDPGTLTATFYGTDPTTLGAQGGSEDHTLTTAEIPAHAHSIIDVAHDHAVLGGTIGGTSPVASAAAPPGSGPSSASTIDIQPSLTGINGTQNAGGGSAHSIVPPGLIVNYIVYAGV